MKDPAVSIIIPAHNCEKIIAATIKAVLQQTYKDCEVIVVDDGSTDRTLEIIQSVPFISWLHQKNAGPASARNAGASTARGEYIFFTDSDCIAHPDWIETGMRHFKSSDIAVVSGSYGIANQDSLLARCIHKEILFRHHKLMPLYPKSFGSYNFGVRKTIFERVGGFNVSYPHPSGEDNDLGYKILNLGYKIYFEKNSLVDHIHTSVLKKYLIEQFRHGFWRVKIYADHPLMMAGDDYTFWKDIVEVAAVIIIFLSFIFFCLSFFKVLMGIMVIFLFVTELYYGLSISKFFFEGFYLTFVMFLRAFVRGFGLSSGALFFIYRKLIKIIQIHRNSL